MSEKQENFTLLGGRVSMQRSHYNPTSDAIWLAAFAPKGIKTVLDVGIGTGAVSLCLSKHFSNLDITGIDNSKTMLNACKKNIELNNLPIELIDNDILTWKSQSRFDLVITNPPYFNGTPAKHNAHHNANIKDWVAKSCARVKPNGYFCIITDAANSAKIVSVLESKHFGNIQIFPLFSTKQTAERVLVRAKLGSKAGSSIFRGLCMNNDLILRDGLTIDALLSKL